MFSGDIKRDQWHEIRLKVSHFIHLANIKNSGFVKFSGGIERNQLHEMS